MVFHTSRGETCPPHSQWILRSLVPPRTWKITDLCTTTLSQRHWIYTLHWSDIHYFLLLLHPLTNKNDGGRIADWLPVWSNVSTFFPPSVSSSSPTVFSFAAVGLELSRPSCSYMDNNRRTPSWAVQEPQKTSSQPPGSWSYSEKPALELIMNLARTRAKIRGIWAKDRGLFHFQEPHPTIKRWTILGFILDTSQHDA